MWPNLSSDLISKSIEGATSDVLHVFCTRTDYVFYFFVPQEMSEIWHDACLLLQKCVLCHTNEDKCQTALILHVLYYYPGKCKQ